MKIGALSLKWRILLFYFMFGFTPLLTISYISYDTASESLSQMTGRQISQLMERISQQTEASYQKARDDIFQLSQNPVIQLSFLQFSYGQRMETLKERLAVYRSNSDTLDTIALFTPEGDSVLSSPQELGSLKYLLTREELKEAYGDNFSIKQHLAGDKKKVVLYKRVYDYEDEATAIGLLVFVMSVHVFTDFIDHVDVAEGMEKEVKSSDGKLVYGFSESDRRYSSYREYSTHVRGLDWDIRLKIPEQSLLKDIIALRNTSLVFAIFIGSIAFISAIFFVKRILTPVRQIINGTKRFSEGDLDYRINMSYGKEMRTLADSFDNMAENLKERQNELVQANKLASLGLMSAGIAHEIKNPLAGIKTSIQVIKRRVRTEANHQLADGIIEEVDRLNKIVSDLLNFSKPTPANMVEYDLGKISKHCFQLMNKDINVKIIDNTQKCIVMVDPAQVQQIMLNLMLNALAAVSVDTGVIEISIYKSCEKAVLEIKDNGRGIPEGKLDKVFDPFFTMTAEGTGLGLSVVFALLRQNGIRHEIESGENSGTVFRLIFTDRGNSDKDSDS